MRYVAVLRRKGHVATSLISETSKILREEGFSAALRFAGTVARGVLREQFAGSQPRKTNIVDQRFGTDTAQNLKLHRLEIPGPNYQHAVYYRATDFPILSEILDRLSLRHEEYTFIDFGSGKGLVLLQAAGYPFRRVIGVEFARELHEIACANVNRYPPELRRCPIELVHGDVVSYSLPDGNLVLYLYEPFDSVVTSQVISRIQRCHRGRDFIIACVWSSDSRLSCRRLWDEQTFLRTVDRGEHWTIYRAEA